MLNDNIVEDLVIMANSRSDVESRQLAYANQGHFYNMKITIIG